MTEYYIFVEDKLCSGCAESVHISLKKDKNMLNSFIDIYPVEDDLNSPLKTTEDAVIFAEAIVKLLESVDMVVNNDDS